jgi:hypothetical protein
LQKTVDASIYKKAENSENFDVSQSHNLFSEGHLQKTLKLGKLKAEMSLKNLTTDGFHGCPNRSWKTGQATNHPNDANPESKKRPEVHNLEAFSLQLIHRKSEKWVTSATSLIVNDLAGNTIGNKVATCCPFLGEMGHIPVVQRKSDPNYG